MPGFCGYLDRAPVTNWRPILVLGRRGHRVDQDGAGLEEQRDGLVRELELLVERDVGGVGAALGLERPQAGALAEQLCPSGHVGEAGDTLVRIDCVELARDLVARGRRFLGGRPLDAGAERLSHAGAQLLVLVRIG
jgi:hypothetical protein